MHNPPPITLASNPSTSSSAHRLFGGIVTGVMVWGDGDWREEKLWLDVILGVNRIMLRLDVRIGGLVIVLG
jgi:hypothetical protein